MARVARLQPQHATWLHTSTALGPFGLDAAQRAVLALNVARPVRQVAERRVHLLHIVAHLQLRLHRHCRGSGRQVGGSGSRPTAPPKINSKKNLSPSESAKSLL